MSEISKSEASQVTVEQLLMQQNMRDEEIKFLRNENAKINAELKISRIIQARLTNDIRAISHNLKAVATISFN
jgi:hypothetical protein